MILHWFLAISVPHAHYPLFFTLVLPLTTCIHQPGIWILIAIITANQEVYLDNSK